MAGKGLRFAGLEWKNITSSKIMWVVIGAIAIMPLLYGALYLAAFEDPYARLNTVPVAVVNADEGATINDSSRNIGDEVITTLSDTENGLHWNFVSADEAQKGLENGNYYMTCTIPSNFSQSIASANDNDPTHAQLLVNYDKSTNLIASQIGESVWEQVRKQLSDGIAAEYWKSVFERTNEAGIGLQTAADGAEELHSGMITAQDGTQTISSNLDTLADGSATLKDGTSSLREGTSLLEDGTNQLKNGTASAYAGAKQLHDEGTSVLASGTSQLASQTSSLPTESQVEQVQQGSQSLTGGIAGLQNAAEQLAGGVNQVKGGIGTPTDASSSTLYGGLNQLSAGIGSAGDTSATSLYGGLNLASAGIGSSTDNYLLNGKQTLYGFLNAAQTAPNDTVRAEMLTAASTATSSLSSGTTALKGAAGQLAGGVDQVKSGIGTPTDASSSTLYGGLNQLSAGIGSASDTSATSLYGGLNSLSAGYGAFSSQILPLVEKSPELRSAILQLNKGAATVDTSVSTLVDGTQSLANGANQVNEGVSSAALGAVQLDDGATQLSSGATQLAEGSRTLADGLISAVDGSNELATQLSSGASALHMTPSQISAKAEVMNDPVELSNSYYTTVKNYGTGFAPYFMALGLWVGCLVAGFVFKPLNKRLILSGGNSFMAAFANYVPMALFALIQATLLMVVLQFGLHLQIDNVPAFYAMGYVVALVFAAIMQLLTAAFGLPGKFLAIIILMLQLTSCAGTFPLQMTPTFFQTISPFMPMTYVVSGMRQIMTGLDYSLVIQDFIILFVLGVVCFLLTVLVAWRKRIVHMEDLHPLLSLG